MFLRTTKGSHNNYVSIVKVYRDKDGKSKQKVVKNLGAFKNEQEKEKLYILGKNLIKSMEGETFCNPEKLTELRRENWGASEVVNKLFATYELDRKLKDLTSDRKIEYDFVSIVKFMVATRFISPMSKLASFINKSDFAGFGNFELHHIYRSLEELHKYQKDITKHIFNQQKKKNPDDINVVFFDVTSLYFESQKSDELRDFGYSKDCKFNEVQIILSLMVTATGRPIGYEIFPGNQYEGHTLLPCLVQLKKSYDINKVIIVADRGLSSFKNLKTIKDHGFDYIIASRVMNLPAEIKNEILSDENYKTLSSSDEETVNYKSIDLTRRSKNKEAEDDVLQEKLLCLYSSKRAKKDASDRERLIKKALEMLESGNYKYKRGAKKYLKIEDKKAEGLDIKKIENAAKYDGYYAISYSDESLSPSLVAGTYRGLWKIEASFRNMKNFFEARPIFHWNAERISGHIALNFICLVLEQYLEQELTKIDCKLSPEDLRKAVAGLQRSVIDIDGKKEMMVYANLAKNQQNLLNLLKIKQP
jgi:transposase